MDIEAFKSKISEHNGLARPSRFRVTVIPPAALGNAGGDASNLTFFCQNAEVAGKAYTTEPIRQFGIPVEIPTGIIFEPLNLTFLCTGSMYERKFFDAWMNYICSVNTALFGYYDLFTGGVVLEVLDEQDNPSYVLQFEEAYPKSIATQALDMDQSNGTLKLQVQFVYRRWIDGRTQAINNSFSAARMGNAPFNPFDISFPIVPKNDPGHVISTAIRELKNFDLNNIQDLERLGLDLLDRVTNDVATRIGNKLK